MSAVPCIGFSRLSRHSTDLGAQQLLLVGFRASLEGVGEEPVEVAVAFGDYLGAEHFVL